MPRYCATSFIVSFESQPFSSCAMTSALITADCFWSAGYFAISRSIFSKALFDKVIGRPRQHDVLGADDRHRVGEHVAARHLVQRGEVRETGRADLEALGLVGAVGDEIHT